jgi:hypothetical protein
MIDLTTIQTFAVAPPIKTLMQTNEMLVQKNNHLTTGIVIVLVVSGIVVYRLWQSNQIIKQTLKKYQ